MSDVPTPTLSYRQPGWQRWTGANITYHSPATALANVQEVTVHENGDVWCIGQMLCRDGHAGPTRSLLVDSNAPQPEWLRGIIDNAAAIRQLWPTGTGEQAVNEPDVGSSRE